MTWLPRYPTQLARKVAEEALREIETNTRVDSNIYTLAQYMDGFAQARIEALQAALREIVAECTCRGSPIKTPQSTEDIFMIARAALDKDAGQ